MSDAPARAAFLRQWMAENGGQARFDEWMRQALYHPRFGYYTTGIRGIGGPRADFSTWPTRDGRLAHALAAWIRTHRWKKLGQPIIEIGPGNAALAAALLHNFRFWEKPKLALVEASPRLRNLQQAKCGRQATWHETPAEALARFSGEALLYSNELVDAFPCRVFRFENPGWSELFITICEGRAQPLWLPARHLPASGSFSQDWPTGQIVEVHEAFHKWLAQWRNHWRRGRFLIVDYGAPDARRLFHRRTQGTLRAYAHQQRLGFPDLLEAFGRRDLTADVNFEDVRQWAAKLNLKASSTLPLHEFLGVAPEDSLDAFWVIELEAPSEQELSACHEKTDNYPPKA